MSEAVKLQLKVILRNNEMTYLMAFFIECTLKIRVCFRYYLFLKVF